MSRNNLKDFITKHRIHAMADEHGYIAWHGVRSISTFIASHEGEHDPCGYGSSKRSAIADLAKMHKLEGREHI